MVLPRRTLTGAWIEAFCLRLCRTILVRRTLTGAWIEAPLLLSTSYSRLVAPSRVRGLKLTRIMRGPSRVMVAPSRVRGLKHGQPAVASTVVGRTLTGAWIEATSTDGSVDMLGGRTLTGAWIEAPCLRLCRTTLVVAPSRVRGLKRQRGTARGRLKPSHPHGCVD